MKKKIDISIILIVRNNWEQIERCLKSLLRQPGIEMEIILLNDDSNDGASSYIKKFADQYDKIYLFEQKYKGIQASRNKAIKQIKGTYTLFIDQNQELLPYALQIVVKEAIKNNSDILQVPYIERKEKNGRITDKIIRMPSIKEHVTGTQYVKKICGKRILPTDNFVTLINSEYLSDKVMRFDYRLPLEYNFDFYSKAIIGAGSILTMQTPLCIINKKTDFNKVPDQETIKILNTEREILRKNFNEYAESNYFSTEQIELLRYVRHMNLMKYGIPVLKKAMSETEFSKWGKYMEKYLISYGGWKNLSRLKLYHNIKKELKFSESSRNLKK